MARNIVLLSDGTGNSAGKLFRTNVWRVYQALDLSETGQVAYYDDGVGTSSLKPLAILGGAFGWGLKRNVLDLYTFLCRNYQPTDRIYGFGFSRGAFTIRVLMKFVLSQGLVTDFNSNDDLRRKARHLYRSFRRGRTTRFGIASAGRALRDFFLWPFRPKDLVTAPVPEIRFLGLWDTVDAYGLPIEEMKNGVDRYIWPLALEDTVLDPRIKKACHALSIDDQRKTFHPLLWDESDPKSTPRVEHTDDEVLTQVWFAGAHSNLGGGYPDDGLSYTSLLWMINEATRAGIQVQPRARDDVKANATPYGRLYNSRVGLAAYYSYEPRYLDPPRDKHGAEIPHPKIHESVIWRMAAGTNAYAPLSLPRTLRIVTQSQAEPQRSDSGPAPEQAKREPSRNIHDFTEYQEVVRAVERPLGPSADPGTERNEQERLAASISTLQQPDERTSDLIWDTVWWRRISYFATLLGTAYLLLYPLLPSYVLLPRAGEMPPLSDVFFFMPPVWDAIVELIGPVTAVINPAVEVLIDSISDFVPRSARWWFDDFKAQPWTLFTLLLLVAVLLLWGRNIDRRISDRALAAWNSKWRDIRRTWLRESASRRTIAAALVIVAALLIVGQAIYLLLDTNAFLADLPGPEAGLENVDTLRAASIARRYFLFSVIIGCVAIVVVALIEIFRVRKIAMEGDVERRELPGFALSTANKLRKSRLAVAAYDFLGRTIAPAGFAIAIVIVTLAGLNRFAFAVLDAGDRVCPAYDSETKSVKRETGEMRFDVSINSGCQTSGLRLVRGAIYGFRIENVKGWRTSTIDPKDMRMGPPGFWTPWLQAPQMLLLFPLRRHWTEPWFAPIVRVGADEHFLLPFGGFVTPKHSGELFFYVNDAVLGWPGVWNYFYRGNAGTATIAVRRVQDPPPGELRLVGDE